MARKLFLLVAFISLVALAPAAPGLAETYNLPSADYTWTETFPLHVNVYTPGSVGSTFSGRYEWGDGGLWQIGGDYSFNVEQGKFQINAPLTNTAEATVETDQYNWFHTFTYTYDDTVTPGEVRFMANIADGPSITSYDAEFTITATYVSQGDGTWTFQNNLTGEYVATIEGIGTNNGGAQFTISGILWEDFGNHNHLGHFIDFQLTYEPSAVPVPGALWLLGTGLLGLFCLGRRRRE